MGYPRRRAGDVCYAPIADTHGFERQPSEAEVRLKSVQISVLAYFEHQATRFRLLQEHSVDLQDEETGSASVFSIYRVAGWSDGARFH
jgi:hypothetical protein